MNSEFEALEKRIEHLESRNRRQKWIGLAIAALALATAVRGQKTGNVVVQAQGFELRDEAGRLRAELGILNGGPALRFLSEDNDVDSLLEGDSFTIFRKGGDIRAAFAADGLSFEDGRDKVFITLNAYEEDQMGKLRLNDYRHKIYTTITAEDLARLHPDKLR